MARVKRGVMTKKRHKNILDQAKGFRWGRSRQYRKAKEAVIKAGVYAHRDRRAKKRSFRGLWITRLNNALRLHEFTYSTFMDQLNKQHIGIDRKVLSQIAVAHPAIFGKIVEKVRSAK